MGDPVDDFQGATPSAVIDENREQAARVCDETAKFMRGERGRLLNPIEHGLRAEFTDEAYGVAGEVAGVVNDALREGKARMPADKAWEIAAKLLRGGWQRGHKLKPMVVKGPPS